MADPFLGEIIMFGGTFAPRGWAFCNGQLLPIAQNSALFSILGTTYGGDGRTTFALPDLRGRVPINSGGNSTGPGVSTYTLGERGGAEDVTLSTSQIPSHTHQARCQSGDGNAASPVGNVCADDLGVSSATYSSAGANADMAAAAIANTGGNQAHNNIQPFLAVNFIIALTGVFPSRN